MQNDLAFTEHMVCISVKGVVYKVTPQFYGPGEPYSVYAGKDISRCLAIGRVDDVEADLPWSQASADAFKLYYSTHPPLPGMEASILKAVSDEEPYDGEFTMEELNTLDLWVQKYEKKYQVVGWYAPFSHTNETPTINCQTSKEVSAVVLEHVNIKASLSAEEVSGVSKPSTSRRGAAIIVSKAESLPTDVLR